MERELKAVHGDQWIKAADEGFPPMARKGAMAFTDASGLLSILLNEWARVFEKTLGKTEKNAIHTLKDIRNRWAHGGSFSGDDTYRAIDTAGMLLSAVSAAPQAEEIEKMKMELLRTRFEDQRRNEERKKAVAPVEGRPVGGLRPWREIITPHKDVASGRYQQAEFAADLWQVYQNEGSDEYRHPVEFFRRTFITDGLKQLLVNAIRRLKDGNGDPVVELQTNFGGGKTHSMLALWHLFSGTKASELPGVDALVKEAEADVVTGVRRAVLVGNRIPPGTPQKKADGTVVRTLWGELAWQLGGRDGYAIVKEADETASNPGEKLRELFKKFSPCLILIDEWVAYARQLHDGIHSLWEREDKNLAIMPANVPIDDSNVQSELTRYLEDNWAPVIGKDVDGPHSLPLALDRDNPNLGKFSATRRVARTIYLGSAPTQKAANRGVDDRRIKLGCVQPGETAATFGDALRRLTGQATFVYLDDTGKRYWYSTQPTVNRLANDRVEQLHGHDVIEEIVRRLRKEQAKRGDFEKVHACPGSNADVPDEMEARLVILSPEYPHAGKSSDSPARKEAASMLDSRGSGPRNYKNSVVFLAADSNRLKELEQAVRQYLAWNSIWDEREQLNLDNFQTKQAETKRRNADDTVDARIPETYQWLLMPGQPDPKGATEWSDIRLQGQDALAVRASRKMKNDMTLLTQMGGNMLRLELDRIPLWRGDHVGLRQLAEDVAKYVYLPRLKNTDVLLAAVQDGVSRLTWQNEAFAYAERFDEKSGRYIGLSAGQTAPVRLDATSLLVKADVAARQIEADRLAAEQERQRTQLPTGVDTGSTGRAGLAPVTGAGAAAIVTNGTDQTQPLRAKLRRFHGSVTLNTLKVGTDAGKIAQEVIQHLSALSNVNVRVTLEIEADIPDGASDDLVRTITENCRTLRFESHGFEEN